MCVEQRASAGSGHVSSNYPPAGEQLQARLRGTAEMNRVDVNRDVREKGTFILMQNESAKTN